MKRIYFGAVCVLLVFALCACGGANDATPTVASDEIALQITMDVQEDFGLLVVDYTAGGHSGSGGISNANKSLLRHDETLWYTLGKADLGDFSSGSDIMLQFTIITEYFTPNFENVYPEENTKIMPAITLTANFGETYCITITGDEVNGYSAALQQ